MLASQGVALAKVLGLMGVKEDEKQQCGEVGQGGEVRLRLPQGPTCRPHRWIRDLGLSSKNSDMCFLPGEKIHVCISEGASLASV